MRCRLALALFVVAASACGPSLRGVADGGAFFERCYSADFDSRVPVAEKRECWEAWSEHYTVGQTPDRVRYAQLRISAIDRGEPSPQMPGVSRAEPAPQAATPSSGGDAEADQAIVDEADEGLGDEADEGDAEESIARERRPRREMPLPRNSNPQCAAVACEPDYRACLAVCERGDGGCETACVVTLRACARGCF